MHRVRLARTLPPIEPLESRIAPAAAFPQFVDPHAAPGNQFGFDLVVLSTGNVVITSPGDDTGGTDVGAVYLFNGATGALISELHGTTANDQVGFGGVTALSNGNFVVSSPTWDNGAVVDAGAVTWGNGMTGISGTVKATNSLVGTHANDIVGGAGGVTALSSGNYVVGSPLWQNSAGAAVGAATWGNGISGSFGAVDATNSLVGSTAGDGVGGLVLSLGNGNYVVTSFLWDNVGAVDAGAVTWGNGGGGTTGAVSAANSLVGTTAGDQVGFNGAGGLIVLSNGNYVVPSTQWDNGGVVDAGAVTWHSGTSGVSGAVDVTNSLVGSTAGDQVGSGLRALTNGNYVVLSRDWDNGAVADVGAATWGSGTSGVVGSITSANSLIGSTNSDLVGSNAYALSNGNYVVLSSQWDNVASGAIVDAGAATWGNGNSGVTGAVSVANSLVGTTANDGVGAAVTLLSNGNYVIQSPNWNNGGVAAVGAATWGDGFFGTHGAVTSANSLVGSAAGDSVGTAVLALTNGNYVVLSPQWDNGAAVDAGAATWGDGNTGISGTVSTANSLVGSSAGDNVGTAAVALTNGNYVVLSKLWDDIFGVADAGAATWANGVIGLTGAVTQTNSLVGSSANDQAGLSAVALTNGNYVVLSPQWDNSGIASAGAVTWGNGTGGTNGPIGAANSLVGSSPGDAIGNEFGGPSVTALSNGNYVIKNDLWDNGALEDAGAITFGDGTTGVKGTINPNNSGLGATAMAGLTFVNVDDTNATFFGTFFLEGGGVIRVGSQMDGFALPAGPDTDVSLSGGNLLITDANGGTSDDVISITLIGGNVRISDSDNILGAGPGTTQVDIHTVDVPFSAITGKITFDALAGTDVLVLDLSNGNPVPTGGISFPGGAPGVAGDDRIEIFGSGQGTVTYNFTNTNDGSVVLSNFGTVNFTSIGLITNFASATDFVFNLPASPNVATLDDGEASADGLSRLSGATFATTDFANPANSLAIRRGNAADTLTVNALPDFDASLFIGLATSPFGAVTFAGTVTLAAEHGLKAIASGTIDLPTASSKLSTTGLGAISLTTQRNIVLANGASITTADGDLNISANQQATPTSGDFTGVFLNNALLRVIGTGSVTVLGKGGDGVAVAQNGVQVAFGADIIGGTSGVVRVEGTGGVPNLSALNFGVIVDEVGSSITSNGADLVVLGLGAYGVIVISDGAIRPGGSGSVVVAGTGTGNNSIGTYVAINSQITSGGSGDVMVEGTASGNGAYGVYVSDTSRITSGGDGGVTVTGTVGVGTGSVGVDVIGGGTITSGAGPVSVTGSATANNVGVRIENGGKITSGSDATITVAADSLDLLGGSINSGNGTTNIVPRSSGAAIDLGGADGLTGIPKLGLTDAELAFIAAGLLQIGDGTGALTLSSAITYGNNLALFAGSVSGSGNLTLTADKNLSITAGGGIDLSGAVTENGTTTLEAGVSDIALTNGDNDLATVVITSGARVTLRDDGGFDLGASVFSKLLSVESASAITQSGVLAGAGGLTKLGTGTLTLSLPNSYGGVTTITAGVLQFDAFSPTLNSQFDLNGGTLAYNLASPSTVLAPTITLSADSIIDVASGTSITLSDVITGPGGLTKTGAGTLILGNEFNSFGPAPLNIIAGTLQVATDGALGDAANPVVFQTATLQTTAAFVSGRHVALQSGVATFQIDGPTLTLIGVIDGTGTSVTTGTGQLLTARTFTGGDVTATPGAPTVVGNTTVAIAGTGTVVVHLVDGDPTKIDTIELMNTTSSSKLFIKSTDGLTTTIQHIINTDPTQAFGSIVLGPGVVLGDGKPDSVADLEIEGKLGKLQLDTISSYAFISLGKGLPYDASGTKTPDTYNNHPDLKIRTVSGPGVVIDVTADIFTASGATGPAGGGGLGKIIVDQWNFPGAIRTTQSIRSFLLKTGDCKVVFSVDKFGVGLLTTSGIGSISVPKGAWASTGGVVEGEITTMTTGQFLAGATITAGKITTFTVFGDFQGSVSSTGAMKNITVKGRFTGSLQAASVGKITAEYFDGTDLANSDPYGDSSRHNINITDAGLGLITAKPHDLDTFGIKNYEITVATTFAGFSVTDKTAPGSFVGIDHVMLQAGAIGNTTVTLTAAAAAKAIRDSVFESNGTMGAITTSHSVTTSIFAAATNIAQVTVKGSLSFSKILAGTFLGDDAALGGVDDAADVFDKSGKVAGVKVAGAFSTSTIAAGVDSVDGIYGNLDDVLAPNGIAPAGSATSIGPLSFGAGSGIIGSSPMELHHYAIEGASLKSLLVDRIAVKPLPTALPKYLDLGGAGADETDVLVRLLS